MISLSEYSEPEVLRLSSDVDRPSPDSAVSFDALALDAVAKSEVMERESLEDVEVICPVCGADVVSVFDHGGESGFDCGKGVDR